MLQSNQVTSQVEGKILQITLNRPEKKNALSNEMYLAMTAGLKEACDNPEIVAVLFNSAGGNFTAGNDLKDFLATAGELADMPAVQFLQVLANFPKILLAAVEGAAIGIGTTMLLHCDLIVAANNTRFQLPFINLGLVPEAASSLLLPRQIGYAKAAELLLLGESFDANMALQLGMINRIVEPENLTATMQELSRTIENKPSQALLATKKLLKSSSTQISERLSEEFLAFASSLKGDEFKIAAENFFKPKVTNIY